MFELELPKSKHSVWDNYVPITVDKHTSEVYLNDDIAVPSEYNELCYRLKNASSAEEFIIHLNTPGGIVDSAFKIVDAIKHTKAKTTAYLTGTVASAGTIITMACDNIIVADHTSFMVHNYSGGVQGKGHEIKAHQNFVDANLNSAFKKIYGGFLTEEEMEKVIDGTDYWFNKEEVLERWKNKVMAPKED